MSYMRATEADPFNEIEVFRSENPLLSNEFINYNDGVCTSLSGSSYNFSKLRSNEVNSSSKQKSMETTETNIRAVSVNDCKGFTSGTIFKGPVMIENWISNEDNVMNATDFQYTDESDSLEARTKEPSTQKRVYCVRKRRFLIWSFIASVVLVITIIGFRHYSRFRGDTRMTHVTFPENLPNDVLGELTVYDGDYQIKTRKEYGALPSKTVNSPLTLPIRQVIISHTVTPDCTDNSTCLARVHQIQNFHMTTRGWDDIGLNFLVGGDGRAYEGCGYTYAAGSHVYPNNNVSICIGFIGNFNLYKASEKQLLAAQRIIDEGIKTKKIHPEYVLYGQKQLKNIDSPVVMLCNQIMLLPHWSKEIIPL